MRLASADAWSSDVTGCCSTTNSSPPKRAMTSLSRTILRNRSATAISSMSPRECPSVSLTCLNWSRSMKWIAHIRSGAHRPARFHAVAQDRPVRQPGERIEPRQVVDLGLRVPRSVVSSTSSTVPPFSIGWTVNSSVRPFCASRMKAWVSAPERRAFRSSVKRSAAPPG